MTTKKLYETRETFRKLQAAYDKAFMEDNWGRVEYLEEDLIDAGIDMADAYLEHIKGFATPEEYKIIEGIKWTDQFLRKISKPGFMERTAS